MRKLIYFIHIVNYKNMNPVWKGRKYKLEKSENFEEFLIALGNNNVS